MQPYIYGMPAYSLFASLGLWVMMMVLYFRCPDIPFKRFLVLIFMMVIGVALGSKCLFILTKIPDMIANFSLKHVIHIILTSGFVFYGGLFGACIAVHIFGKVYKADTVQLLNLCSMGFAAFHMFGRIGCFFAGCCYGKEANWGFALENEPEILRIPIQLIESGCIFIILLVIVIIEKIYGTKKKSFKIYLGLYAICRFCTEYFRGDVIRGTWGWFSTSQWISLAILFCLGVSALKCWIKRN